MLSIFLPTYNCASFVQTTIESVLAQSYPNFELLCVDDGSTDDTLLVLNRLASHDARIRVFTKANEGCVPYAWNYIFPHLQGEFTLYLSHDDVLPTDYLEVLVKQITPTTDAVISSVVFFQHDMQIPEPQYAQLNTQNDLTGRPTQTGRQAFLDMLNYDIPGFALWRTSLIRSIGMPTESFNSDEAMQRIWALNCRNVAFAGVKFGYRQSDASITKGLKPYHFNSLLTQKRLLNELKWTEFLFDKRVHRFVKHFLRSWIYLVRQYWAHRKCYSCSEKMMIERAIRLKSETSDLKLKTYNL